MRGIWSLVLMSSCLCSIGCGGGPEPVVKTTEDAVKEKTATSTADLKKRLEEVAASGISGSGLMGLNESIDKVVRPTDAKLADALATDFNLLTQTTDPAEIKTIATRMASKL